MFNNKKPNNHNDRKRYYEEPRSQKKSFNGLPGVHSQAFEVSPSDVAITNSDGITIDFESFPNHNPDAPNWYGRATNDYLKHLKSNPPIIHNSYGYVTHITPNNDGVCIAVTDEEGVGIPGAISGMAIDRDYDNGQYMSTPVTIVNTENEGFRYAVVMDEAGNTDDLGPVAHTCIIGNLERPEAIFVPLDNVGALYDARDIIDSQLDKYNQNVKLAMEESMRQIGEVEGYNRRR